MTCSEFLDGYSEYLDGLIASPGHRRQFDRHLTECPGCRRYDVAVRRGVHALRDLPPVDPSADFRRRLDARLRQAVFEVPKAGPLLSVAAMLLVAVAIALVAFEGRPRPTPSAGAPLEPVPFPHPVAQAAPPFVSFQDPRTVVLTGSAAPYGASVTYLPATFTGPAGPGR